MNFLENFQTVFSATAQVLLLCVCGFVLVRRKVLDPDGLNQLTRLAVDVFLPFFIFHQLVTHFSFEQYPRWWLFPLLSASLMTAGYLLGRLALIFLPKFEAKRELVALTAFQNAGNIPLMLVTTLFTGEFQQTLFVYIFLFIIGFNLLIWTVGVRLVAPHKMTRKELMRGLNPPVVATLATLALIAAGAHHAVPDMILKPVKLLGDCAVPLAMLVVGGNLGCINAALVDRRGVAALVLTKLIVMPALMLAAVLALRLDYPMGFLLVMEAGVPSAVTLSLIGRYYKIDTKFINQGLLYVNLASIITLPLFLTLYMRLFSAR